MRKIGHHFWGSKNMTVRSGKNQRRDDIYNNRRDGEKLHHGFNLLNLGFQFRIAKKFLAYFVISIENRGMV